MEIEDENECSFSIDEDDPNKSHGDNDSLNYPSDENEDEDEDLEVALTTENLERGQVEEKEHKELDSSALKVCFKCRSGEMQDQFLECASCNGSRSIYHKFCLPESEVKISSNGDWFCLTCIKYFEESSQDECEDSDFEDISTVQYTKRAKQSRDAKIPTKKRPTRNNFDPDSSSDNDTKPKHFKRIQTSLSFIEAEEQTHSKRKITSGVYRRKININEKKKEAYLKRFNNANKKFDDLPSFERLYTVKRLLEKLGWKDCV